MQNKGFVKVFAVLLTLVSVILVRDKTLQQ